MKDIQPPSLPIRLLHWFAGHADLEDILGDLDEIYFIKVARTGKFKADMFYWYQIMVLLFSYAVKNIHRHQHYWALTRDVHLPISLINVNRDLSI